MSMLASLSRDDEFRFVWGFLLEQEEQSVTETETLKLKFICHF